MHDFYHPRSAVTSLSLLFFVCLGGSLGLGSVRAAGAEKYDELDSARVDAIAHMLSGQPAGFGKPIGDRTFWSSLSAKAVAGNVVFEAEKLLARPFPAWDDSHYLDYSKTGQRPTGEKMMRARDGWLYPLAMAECIENKGRFLPQIREVLLEYVKQPTWTLPAHDGDLGNFQKRRYSVDLSSSAMAAQLAQAIYLLGEKLDSETKEKVLSALNERVFSPVRESLRTGKGNWWLGSTSRPVQNNWNAVCLAGVAGAARTVLPDPRDRAVFLAAGEHYSKYFVNGFRGDGYCDEGYGYWSYGFGNYSVLREILMDATRGKVDLFKDPKVAAMALYGVRAVMVDARVPTFADCRLGTKADRLWVAYCNSVLNLGLPEYPLSQAPGGKALQTVFMGATPVEGAGTAKGSRIGPRSFFENAGVLVSRPIPGSPGRLGVAVKAGGNTSHSHNDIGSFVIALNGELPVGDPGGPHAYNSQTFGPRRYENKLLNSFGHPVPVVDGKLQKDATKVVAKILSTKFTDAADEIRIDMRPAYDVPGLKKLERLLTYARAGSGQVVVEDVVESSRPIAFEIALPATGSFKQLDERRIEFAAGQARLIAVVETPDGFTVSDEVVSELAAPSFHRVGLKLLKPVTSAKVRVTFRPAD